MKITRNNYEQVLLDYFDGNLNPVETACLMLFLEENPDLRECFDNFECIKLDEPSVCPFHAKAVLKRQIIAEGDIITEDNYLQVFFDDAEGLLPESQKAALPAFLQKNPSLQREYYSWRNAHLIPETIVFEDKASLKKIAVVPLYRNKVLMSGIAAGLALLIAAAIIVGYLGKSADSATNLQALQFNNPRTPVGTGVIEEAVQYNSTRQKSVLADNGSHQPKPQIEKHQPSHNAREKVIIITIPSNSQIASLANDQSRLPDGLADYQSEYTDLMQLIARRQQLLEKANSDQYASTDEDGNGTLYKAGNTVPSRSSNSRINFWDIAELGVTGYNALTKKDVSFIHRTDASGRTSGLALGSFAFERK